MADTPVLGQMLFSPYPTTVTLNIRPISRLIEVNGSIPILIFFNNKTQKRTLLINGSPGERILRFGLYLS
jgi:hypothetical protein